VRLALKPQALRKISQRSAHVSLPDQKLRADLIVSHLPEKGRHERECSCRLCSGECESGGRRHVPDLNVVRAIASKLVPEKLNSGTGDRERGIAVARLLIPEHDPSRITVGIKKREIDGDRQNVIADFEFAFDVEVKGVAPVCSREPDVIAEHHARTISLPAVFWFREITGKSALKRRLSGDLAVSMERANGCTQGPRRVRPA
jgi:hypothetical protein